MRVCMYVCLCVRVDGLVLKRRVVVALAFVQVGSVRSPVVFVLDLWFLFPFSRSWRIRECAPKTAATKGEKTHVGGNRRGGFR
jgi:hypothetical protein